MRADTRAAAWNPLDAFTRRGILTTNRAVYTEWACVQPPYPHPHPHPLPSTYTTSTLTPPATRGGGAVVIKFTPQGNMDAIVCALGGKGNKKTKEEEENKQGEIIKKN